MSKRLQIPVSTDEDQLFKSAARVYQVPTAEWARRILKKAAERDIAGQAVLDPLEAVKLICNLNAPVSEVDQMNKEATKGRLE